MQLIYAAPGRGNPSPTPAHFWHDTMAKDSDDISQGDRKTATEMTDIVEILSVGQVRNFRYEERL